jgi:hypothetical protein
VASCGGVTVDILKKYIQDQDSPESVELQRKDKFNKKCGSTSQFNHGYKIYLVQAFSIQIKN